MTARDLALIAYRVLALWIAVSGLMALVETLLTWESIVAQTMATMAAVSNPPSERAFFWMTTSALGARALFGFLLWWVAPALARRTPVSKSHEAAEPSRHALYSAAAFLVGVWLVSESLPGLAFTFHAATRPGVPAYDDGLGGARLAQLLAQFLLGVAFIRGGWLVDLAIWSRGDKSGDEEPERGV